MCMKPFVLFLFIFIFIFILSIFTPGLAWPGLAGGIRLRTIIRSSVFLRGQIFLFFFFIVDIFFLFTTEAGTLNAGKHDQQRSSYKDSTQRNGEK